MTQSRNDLQKLERLEAASEAAIKTFEACVDFGKVDTDALLATVSEYLAGLDPTMLARVTGLKEGVLLKTKFLPTVADFHALVKELEAKDSQFRPAHTTWKRFDPDNFENEKTPEQRREFIRGLELHKHFPEGAHRKPPVERVLYEGEPTERQLNPNSKFELPKEFPQHLLETEFIQGHAA